MQLVIDANILIAAFLKAATTRFLLLDERLDLYAPEHLVVETLKVAKERLLKRWKSVSETEFESLFLSLTRRVQIVSQKKYFPQLSQALEIAPHEEDAPYLALALHLQIPLWSNDGGMKDQTFITIFTTAELLKKLRESQPPAG